MRILGTIAVHSFRDILRSRILYAVIAYAAVVMGVAVLAGEWTLGEQIRLVTDVGLGAMVAFGLLLVLTRGAETISREVERKTVRVMLARPIQRWQFVVGSFLGMVMALALLIAALLAVLCVALIPIGGPSSWGSLFIASWGILLELLMIAAVALLASNLSSPVLATLLTLLVFCAGHMASGLHEWIQGTATDGASHLPDSMAKVAMAYQSGPLNVFLRVAYFALPIMTHVNFKAQAANAVAVPAMRVVVGSLYALVYTTLVTLVGVGVFRRRDIS
ncbi:ABC transporter permease subunit [Candidatus Fermentibacteria bacterium]|nr:ABC transporter permease subunit [Candidatus Fermentibacteria bacterium]